eukprot:CAMPEP_0194277954 /NCGR_PEP_ID=MMETSP0169-20130528/10139_1 /TAXON_ID=218684 /ORGANISM="Corethron pennatum, Strain L29A3" /LENGTH=94 /DNA_ID=CAMNT_0039022041 /DNA_START=27 /DNA_END=308 /DNA_ORIENTATION=+
MEEEHPVPPRPVQPSPSDIDGLIRRRIAARSAQRYEAADALQFELLSHGVTVTDNKHGTASWCYAAGDPAGAAAVAAAASAARGKPRVRQAQNR